MTVTIDPDAPRPAAMMNAGLLLLVLLAVASAGMLASQAMLPVPRLVVGLAFDRLTAILSLLVTLVGAVVYRFSLRQLSGHPRQRRFLFLLLATVCAADLLMLSDNLLLLCSAWFLTSLLLHALLTFYDDRPQALPPARKKFLVSRLGDVALLAAILLIWHSRDTTSLHAFLHEIPLHRQAAADTVPLLIAMAALTKSAQFPFHSWLPETMESPTPVSALMHAGIINAGGALLLRFAPVISVTLSASLLLIGVGTATAALAILATWAQVKVKRTLAWSTVAQMGFMMVQCGLGVFPAAALHIVGHGLYKAFSFLRAGGLPAQASPARVADPRQDIVHLLIGIAAAAVSLVLASRITGFNPASSPGELALCSILAIALAQIWVPLLRPTATKGQILPARYLLSVILTFTAAIVALSLYRGAASFLSPVIGLPRPEFRSLAVLGAILPVFVLFTLSILHIALPLLSITSAGRALYVHALHGFYFGTIADRLVQRVWPVTSKEISHA